MSSLGESKSNVSSITPKSAVSSLKYDRLNQNDQLFNDRYQLRKELGKGKYGKVFLARDLSRGIMADKNKQRVAIKIVNQSLNDGDIDETENAVFQKLYDQQKEDKDSLKGLPTIIDHGVNMGTK